jgi:pyruvate,water dikinase
MQEQPMSHEGHAQIRANASGSALVLPFSSISKEDVALVGGKNASLGEMYQQLRHVGVRVPDGFAVTAAAYRRTLAEAGVVGELRRIFAGLDHENLAALADAAADARDLVRSAALPEAVRGEVIREYRRLQDEYGKNVAVAVRSSATAEDLPTASFAGQHESYLDICGEAAVLDAVSRCFASAFTDRGVHYRAEHGFGQLDVALSVGVMKMVRSDLACSGVMFTLDTETGFPDVVMISSSYGLGENVVQGAVDPTSSWSTSRPSAPAAAPCCAGVSARRPCAWCSPARVRPLRRSTWQRRRTSARASASPTPRSWSSPPAP